MAALLADRAGAIYKTGMHLRAAPILLFLAAIAGCTNCQGLPGYTGVTISCGDDELGTGRGQGSPDGGGAQCTRINELRSDCTQSFIQGGGVDIVWVIDNSGSMDTEIRGVRDNLNRFAQRISDSGLDYRIVLVTDAPTEANGVCVAEPLAGPDCSNSPRFRHIKRRVDSTDGPDVLLESEPLYRDFLRPEAQQGIVFVTDDNATMRADVFRNSATGTSLDNATVHGVVGLDTNQCPDIANIGTQYIELANDTGGKLIPICCDDYSKLVNALADDIAASAVRFRLDRPAREGTIHVFLLDAAGTATEVTSGWSYDAAAQAVVFDDAMRPAPGTRVRIDYQS